MPTTRESVEPPDTESDGGQDSSVERPRGDLVRATTAEREETSVFREGVASSGSASNAESTRRFSEDPVTREQEPLDFSPSSTATSPEAARKDLGTEYAVGRFAYTDNATYTDEELPAQSTEWQTLNDLNRDAADKDDHLQTARRKQDRHNDLRMWADEIGLTDTETRIAGDILESIPSGVLRNFGTETVICGILTIVANQNTYGEHTVKSIRLDGPSAGHPALVERYERIRSELGVRKRRVSDFRRWYDQNHS